MYGCLHPLGWYIHGARLGGCDEPPNSPDVGFGDSISVWRYIYGAGPGCKIKPLLHHIKSRPNPFGRDDHLFWLSSLPTGSGRFACRNTQITQFGRWVWAPSWSKASHPFQHSGQTQHNHSKLPNLQSLRNQPQ